MRSEKNPYKYKVWSQLFLTRGQWLLSEAVSRRSFFALVLFILSALLLEYLSYQQIGVISWITPRLWLASGLLLALVIIFRSVQQLIQDIKTKTFLPILFTLCLIGLLLWPLIDPSRGVIGQDATQQVAAGLNAFTRSAMNYTGRAFLGYPSRQYLLAA